MGEHPSDRRQSRLGLTLAVDEPEVPVEDLAAATVPFIRPRKHEGPSATGLKRRPQLPLETLRLALAPVPPTVEPNLAQDQWPIASDVVQTSEVRLEVRLPFEINVEAHQIEERQVQVLRRGVVDVGDQRVGVLLLGRGVQPLEELLDATGPVPAND